MSEMTPQEVEEMLLKMQKYLESLDAPIKDRRALVLCEKHQATIEVGGDEPVYFDERCDESCLSEVAKKIDEILKRNRT